MIPEEITEGNFYIANFIGFEYPDKNNKVFELSYWELHNYHEDWNLLMPVVEKIEKGNPYFVRIEETECLITIKGSVEINKYGDTKIEAVWLAVVDFIKFHNQPK